MADVSASSIKKKAGIIGKTKGSAYEPMHIGYQDYGDDYNVGWAPEEEFIFLRERLSNATSIEEVEELTSNYKELLDIYNTIAPDEEDIVTCNGQYYETISRHALSGPTILTYMK